MGHMNGKYTPITIKEEWVSFGHAGLDLPVMIWAEVLTINLKYLLKSWLLFLQYATQISNHVF